MTIEQQIMQQTVVILSLVAGGVIFLATVINFVFNRGNRAGEQPTAEREQPTAEELQQAMDDLLRVATSAMKRAKELERVANQEQGESNSDGQTTPQISDWPCQPAVHTCVRGEGSGGGPC